jgi:hypothetical protein
MVSGFGSGVYPYEEVLRINVYFNKTIHSKHGDLG